MAERLAGKVGVITGGASGIGPRDRAAVRGRGQRARDRRSQRRAARRGDAELVAAVETEVVDVTVEADVERTCGAGGREVRRDRRRE